MSKSCPDCSETFRMQRQLDEHWDRFHRPPLMHQDGIITLNAPDQIRLILKEMKGGWENYFKSLSKKQKQTQDYKDAKRLQRYEKRHKIEFIVCGSEVKKYRCLEE